MNKNGLTGALKRVNAALGKDWRNVSLAEMKRVLDLSYWRSWTDDEVGVAARVPAKAVSLIRKYNRGPHSVLVEKRLENAIQNFPHAVKLIRKGMKPKAEFDQLFATAETVIQRLRMLANHGDLWNKDIALIGDDDLLSAALSLTVLPASITVLDIDQELINGIQKALDPILDKALRYDVRKPLPKDLKGRFDTVFTDPPYTIQGQLSFLRRARELLRTVEGSVCYHCYSPADLSAGNIGLVQDEVRKLGFAIDAIWPGLNEYQEAKRARGEPRIRRFRSNLARLMLVTDTRINRANAKGLYSYDYKLEKP